MKLRKLSLAILVPMVITGFAVNTIAQEKTETRQVQTKITMGDVLKKLQNVEHSRIIGVELENEFTGSYFEVEFIDKKNVLWKHKYDATTGKLIGSSQKQTKKPVTVKTVSVEQILNTVQKNYQGKVIEIKLDDNVYEVELIDKNGVIRELEYDASTGRFIREEKDD